MEDKTAVLILNEITEIGKRLSVIERRTRAMPSTVTRDDIARELGCDKSLLTHKPYLVPKFGVSDYEGRTHRWDIEVWEKWKAIPVIDRKREWDSRKEGGNAR